MEGQVQAPKNLRVLMAHHLAQIVGEAKREEAVVHIDSTGVMVECHETHQEQIEAWLQGKGIKSVCDLDSTRAIAVFRLVPKLNPYLEDETAPKGARDANELAEGEGEGEGEPGGDEGEGEGQGEGQGGSGSDPDSGQFSKNQPSGSAPNAAKRTILKGKIEVTRDDTRQKFRATFIGADPDHLLKRAVSQWLPSAMEACRDLGFTTVHNSGQLFSPGRKDAKRLTTTFETAPSTELIIERS